MTTTTIHPKQEYAEAMSAYMETARQMDAFTASMNLDEADEATVEEFFTRLDELDARIGHEGNARALRQAKARLLEWGREAAMRQADPRERKLIAHLFANLTRPSIEARVVEIICRLDIDG